MKITRASLVIEVDGKTCAANLSTVNLDLMVNMIAALTDGGTLQVVPIKEDARWSSMGEGKE